MSERVKSVEHAMSILRLLIERGETGASEAAAAIGVAPSTAHRILATVVAQGFATQTPDRRYRIGPMLTPKPMSQVSSLVARVRPILREVYERVGETVHLLVLMGTDVQFVDGVEGAQALRVGLRIGARIPAYCTSGGKAILADLTPGAVEALHGGILPPWPSQRVTSLAQLHAELAEIRASGIAVNKGESEAGVLAVGVAIPQIEGALPAALAIALPQERYMDTNRRLIVAALQSGAARATRLITA